MVPGGQQRRLGQQIQDITSARLRAAPRAALPGPLPEGVPAEGGKQHFHGSRQ